MAEAEAADPFSTFIGALTSNLRDVVAEIGIQNVTNVIPKFNGDPKTFKQWMKSIVKYGTLKRLSGEKLKLLAYETSIDGASDFMQRFFEANPEATWERVKTELKLRFAEIQDPQYAFSLLRNIKQKEGENVQIYATRLLELAEDAYVFRQDDLPMIEKQLIGYFTDGLAYGYLRMKIMRDNPATFQDAVNIASNEQNLRIRFNLRSGECSSTLPQNTQQQVNLGPEPMEIGHLRPKTRCDYCTKIGHVAADCRKRLREINMFSKTDSPHAPRQNNYRSNVECWNCGKLGHISRFCRSQKQARSFKNQEN